MPCGGCSMGPRATPVIAPPNGAATNGGARPLFTVAPAAAGCCQQKLTWYDWTMLVLTAAVAYTLIFGEN